LLIGLSIAQNARERLPHAFKDAFAYLDQGAVWGIVAAILRAENTRSVVAAVRGAIADSGVVAAGEGGEPDFIADSGGSAPGDETTAPPDGGNGGGGGGDRNNGGGEKPPDDGEPSPPPEDECETTIDCTLEGIGVEPSPSPTGVVTGQ
jgi:hypothetical protein